MKVLQVRSSVLYFFLLVLQVFFNFILDIVYKSGGFSKTLLKEVLKFVPGEWSNPVSLNLSFVLLSAKIDSIAEEQSCKVNALVAYGTGYIKIIFTLLAKLVASRVSALIIQVGVLGLEKTIVKSGVCLMLIIFVTLKKQF